MNTKTDPPREVQAVALFVELIHAHRRSDHLAAADALEQLDRLGIRIRFAGKGVANV